MDTERSGRYCKGIDVWALTSQVLRSFQANRICIEDHRYWPDFIILMTNGIHLVLEIKGQHTERDRVKRGFQEDWVIVVNYDGRFGKWTCDVSFDPAYIPGAIGKRTTMKAELANSSSSIVRVTALTSGI